MNPYVKYRHMGFNAEQFIKMTHNHPHDFIMYCEVVVTGNGLVFLASPSHYQTVAWLEKKGFKNCCEVWYSVSQCEGTLTKSQKHVLDDLYNAKLISKFAAYCLRKEDATEWL